MSTELAEKIVEDFEQGKLSRRQLAMKLVGLGAAMAGAQEVLAGENRSTSTFRATSVDHVALNVGDIARSRDFYIRHLGLTVVREGANHCFLGQHNGFFLALFRREPVGLNHYCYALPRYEPDQAESALRKAGLEPRREQNRLYFDDPDGIEVQITGERVKNA